MVGHVVKHCAVLGQLHPEGQLVATGRVDVVHLRLIRVAQTRMLGVLVVVQDNFLVHGLQVHQFTPKKSRAWLIASTRIFVKAW